MKLACCTMVWLFAVAPSACLLGEGSSADAGGVDDDGGGAGFDAGFDAAGADSGSFADASIPADATWSRFDFAYLSEYELASDEETQFFTMYGVGAVINTGSIDLDTTTIEIVGTASDHPDVEVRGELQAWQGPVLEPGSAAGGLNAVAQEWVLPLIDEPCQLGQPTFRTEVIVDGPLNEVVHATITVALDGAVATLPLTFTIGPKPPNQPTIVVVAADRVSSSP